MGNYPPSTWRLLKTQPTSGAWNMAMDEAILEAVARGEVPPTLRLYAWQPPCLSIGYAQPSGDAELNRLNERGWELVRRPTGGRAILHTDELTYAVIAPSGEPCLAGGVLGSYRRLSGALLSVLEQLGVPTQIESGKTTEGTRQEAVCFEIPSNYEITANGKKLIGSAQARKKNVVLQHGTLPLKGDLSRITQVLRYPEESARRKAAQRLIERATTVEAVLGYRPSWEAAAEAFAESFLRKLNLTLVPGEATPAERSRTHELVQVKYANKSWTMRV